VLWALRTNVNRAVRDTPFNLVYGAELVLPSEIYLESVRVAHFNTEDQTEARELDSDLLEERCNTVLANVRKYQASLKLYYNKVYHDNKFLGGRCSDFVDFWCLSLLIEVNLAMN
jgi:hypothetical protein